ncbi:TetR/AcrR family transcriptional regulator [Sneathiella litorea]|uniref:TetR family transcriptional regulator n=1 Tax=Sneathiella litorea TaxID=2606216 RepID=A0A6L8W811_9PROT|nr:TetR/AcrR family transcriptional regulator [Sneathiella litorea]MZR30654.1 TetR family transcriptional regulator [Sneathiella litorea]
MKAERMRTRREQLRIHIINSAIKVVGRHGYAKASMARIAEEAGVPYGSIYLYFRSHHDLLHQLLPMVSETLRAAIREKSGKARTFLEHETVSFDVLFEQTSATSGKQRVFAEAPFFVPKVYDAYMESMAESYIRLMYACKARGEFPNLEEQNFEAIAYSLMGAKQFLLRRYILSNEKAKGVPQNVRDTYLGMVEKIFIS